MMESCNWPIAYVDCVPPADGSPIVYPKPLEEMGDDQREHFEKMAADFLWNWTGRLFGVCDVAVRPCKQGCNARTDTFWGRGPFPGDSSPGGAGAVLAATGWWPALLQGTWQAVGCGCLSGCRCGLDGAQSLSLPGPVVEVAQVMIDGQVLSPTAYRVDYGRMLIRQDGQRWPACQDMTLAADAVGSFEIQYTKGVAVPYGGQLAAGALAVQLAKAFCNDKTCELPQRVQTITREGVTIGFQDMFEDIDKGHTGIWSIDSWVASINTPRPRAGVRSVDVPNRVVSGAWTR